jgi:hypothetical protein
VAVVDEAILVVLEALLLLLLPIKVLVIVETMEHPLLLALVDQEALLLQEDKVLLAKLEVMVAHWGLLVHRLLVGLAQMGKVFLDRLVLVGLV